MATVSEIQIKDEPKYRIRWKVLVPLTLLHLGALAAPFFYSDTNLAVFLILWLVTGLFGITVGYHRLLAHRAFQTKSAVRAFHLACASISLQQGPISWVRIHRAHHKFADRIEDPHYQDNGFFFGHMGWSFLAHRQIGRSDLVKQLPNDLKNDRLAIFFERWHYPIFLASLLLFYAIGGLGLLLWAGCLRTVFVMHITWSVNSITHRFGTRTHETRDKSTNHPVIAFLAWGEGWHNNHHRFPNSARQGLHRLEYDPSWYWIKFLSLCGLAWDIRLPKRDGVNPGDTEWSALSTNVGP